MAHVKFDVMIPWPLLRKHLEQQQKAVDSKLRRAVEPEAAVLRGQAQFIEALLNLPETLQTLADEDERAEREKG
jgi:hypothetical protein